MNNVLQFKPRGSGKPENYKGIKIASRRDSAQDITTVRRVVDALQKTTLVTKIRRIELDGNACAVWTCVGTEQADLDLLSSAISRALIQLFSGYNMLNVTSLDGKQSELLGPYWNEDYKDFEPGMPA